MLLHQDDHVRGAVAAGAPLEGDHPCAPRHHAGDAAVRGAAPWPFLILSVLASPALVCVVDTARSSHINPLTIQTPQCCLAQMLTVAAIMPLGVQLVYLREFAHLNPLIPTQYFRLCKQVYRAFSQNEGKVRWAQGTCLSCLLMSTCGSSLIGCSACADHGEGSLTICGNQLFE